MHEKILDPKGEYRPAQVFQSPKMPRIMRMACAKLGNIHQLTNRISSETNLKSNAAWQLSDKELPNGENEGYLRA